MVQEVLMWGLRRVLLGGVLCSVVGCAGSQVPPSYSSRDAAPTVSDVRAEAPSGEPILEVLPVETRAAAILRMTGEAREWCGAFDVRPHKHNKPERHVVVCAWSERMAKWKRIDLRFHHTRKASSVTSETEGCVAEYVGGTGPVRFRADIFCNNEKLVVYHARHYIPARKKTVGYTAYSADLHDSDLSLHGMQKLSAAIRTAQAVLRDMQVPSRSFPGELVADVPFGDVVLALAAIEQADHDTYFGDRLGTIESSYIGYMLNDTPYAYACSHMGACGPMQFMPKTYRIVRTLYPSAHLISDFDIGARDLPNVLKASILLLDLELSSMTREVRQLFRDDPTQAGAFLAAAYNGGPAAARGLLGYLYGNGLDIKTFVEEDVPNVLMVRGRRGMRKNRESPVFVQKYLFTKSYIEKHRPLL